MSDGLPPYVYPRKRRSAYIWRPYVKGLPRREIRLCSINAPISEVWKAWEDLNQPAVKAETLEWLLFQYRDSSRFGELNALSQKQNRSRITVICEFQFKSGKAFGSIKLSQLTPGIITRFMEAVRADGSGSPSRANGFKNVISAAWKWAQSRDVTALANPAERSITFSPRSSDRYVTDEEYKLFYQLAKESKHLWLPSFMELAYLCRLRQVEVTSLTHEDRLDQGLLCERVKGSKTNIVGWTPRLEAAIMEGGEYLVYWKDGSKLNPSRIAQVWNRVMDQESYNLPRFTPHALKAKGISDTDRLTRRGSAGHKSQQAENIYDRTVDVVDAVD